MAKEQQAPGPRIEIEGRVKETPRVERVRGGKLVAHLEVAASKVTIDGREENAQAHKWQRITLWGIDAKRAPETYPQGSRVKVEGDREIRTWESEKGPRENAEIHNARIEVLEKGRSQEGERVEFSGTLIYRPELLQTKGGQDYIRLAVDSESRGRETVLLWGEKAERAADTLQKGSRVQVEGERVYLPYERNGEQVPYYEVHKAKVQDLGMEKGEPGPARERNDAAHDLGL